MANLWATFQTSDHEVESARIRYERVADFKSAHASATPPVLKMVLDETVAGDALPDLARMNISWATIYPGLEGFARSLDMKVRKRAKYNWR